MGSTLICEVEHTWLSETGCLSISVQLCLFCLYLRTITWRQRFPSDKMDPENVNRPLQDPAGEPHVYCQCVPLPQPFDDKAENWQKQK